MPHMTRVKCDRCGDTFLARTADVNRGWGKFCSKSCKAIKQERRTGQNAAYHARQRNREDDYADGYDLGWDAHKS